MSQHKKDIYLGDGLYVRDDGWRIELCSTDGHGRTNRLDLDPAQVWSLLSYLEQLNEGGVTTAAKVVLDTKSDSA